MLDLTYIDRTQKLASGELEACLERHSSLLKDACDGHREYTQQLGWLRVNEWAGETALDKTLALAEKIRSITKVFVLIGVGGSNNAARAVLEALKPRDGVEVMYAGNTLSPIELNRLLERLDGKDVYINCIAKNFETLEPGASFLLLRQYLIKRYGGEEAARRILCTGTPGNRLEVLCRTHHWEFIEFPENLGGRFTALSYVHILPLAVAGVDVRAMAKGAAEMERQLKSTPAKENAALRYAALRNLFYQKGYRVELLASFEPSLRGFFKWWEQLFAESEGKQGKGLLPVTGQFSEELHSLGQFIQEGTPILFETFLDVKASSAGLVLQSDGVDDGFDYLIGKDFEEINRASFEATRKAHGQTLPCLTLEIDALDAYHFGQLFYFFQFACYLSACMLGVNPFDQPGVEAYKGWMFKALGK